MPGGGGGGGGPGPPGPAAAGGAAAGASSALKNKKKEMDLSKKEKPKDCGPMKKIGKAWPNEEDQPPISAGDDGELCWMVLLCTVRPRISPSPRPCPRPLPGCPLVFSAPPYTLASYLLSEPWLLTNVSNGGGALITHVIVTPCRRWAMPSRLKSRTRRRTDHHDGASQCQCQSANVHIRTLGCFVCLLWFALLIAMMMLCS
jgi:hypothetical protein